MYEKIKLNKEKKFIKTERSPSQIKIQIYKE